MRSLKDDIHGMIDIGLVLTIGLVFTALMVIAFIVWTLMQTLMPYGAWTRGENRLWTQLQNDTYNETYNSMRNVTTGFDNAVTLFLVAIVIFILAIAITALLMLRGR